MDASKYSAVETLRDGTRIEIRALRLDDQAALMAALRRTSSQSLYLRFFGAKRDFTDKEVEFFLNIDFVNHVALVAVADEAGRSIIVGGGRYVMVEPGKAELAFVVVDQYQGRGIGGLLLRHLLDIARDAGLAELVADVLPSNAAMLNVFEKSGFQRSAKREGGAVRVALRSK